MDLMLIGTIRIYKRLSCGFSKASMLQLISLSQGASAFFENIDDYLRQERRKLLGTTLKDLRDVTEKYLVDNQNNLVTVIGDNEILNVDNKWQIRNFQV